MISCCNCRDNLFRVLKQKKAYKEEKSRRLCKLHVAKRHARDGPLLEKAMKRVHHDVPLLELTVSRAESELGEYERVIEMRKDAERQHRHWQDSLKQAAKDLKDAEIKLVGKVI